VSLKAAVAVSAVLQTEAAS